MPDDIKIGSHDKGLWDVANKVIASNKPIASNLNINDAISKAKANPGAELIVVDDSGNAKVHSLSVKDSFTKEKKTIDIKELDRDPAKKLNNAKTPLAIDDNIASVFKGKGAFLVDAKNNVTYLGDRVDQTNAQVILKDSEKFTAAPNKNKVDTAYLMGTEAGNTKKIETNLANNVLNDLSENYKETPKAESAVNLLKNGEVKTKMQSLLSDLKSIDKNNNSELNDLQGQLKNRTDKYKSDLAAPAKRLNNANQAWQTASNQEEQKVKTAYHNAREAKMPGVYNLEETLAMAQSQRNNAKDNLDNAIESRVHAESRLENIERLPGEIENLKQNNSRLERENRSFASSLVSYLSITSSQLSSDIRSRQSDVRSYEMELSIERNKPTRPANGGGSDIHDDPFSNKKSVTDDPFSNTNSGNYRNESKISNLENNIREANSQIRELDSRESSLSALALRVTVNSDLSTLSTFFLDLNYVDRAAINNYSQGYENNKREIANNNQMIRDKDSQYDNNLQPARNEVSQAKTNEAQAQGVYSGAEANVAKFAAQLETVKNNPLPDNNPKVLAAATIHKKALEHQEATVGEKAPLTVEKNSAQLVVDNINKSYSDDKNVLENKMNVSSNSSESKAQGLIKDTRSKL